MPDNKDIMLMLGEIRSTQHHHGQKLDSIVRKVETHEDLKNKVLGACAVISVGVGLFIDGVKDAIGGLISK